MKKYKCRVKGPQTSITVHGVHFRSDQFRVLQKDELPLSMSELRALGISVEEIVADRPETPAAVRAGVVWEGMSPKKTNDYGSFVRGAPRYDLTPEEIDACAKLPGFRRV